MVTTTRKLLIGSIAPYSGKTAVILGIGHWLQQQNKKIGYGKPLGDFSPNNWQQPDDADLRFVSETFQLEAAAQKPTLLFLNEVSQQKRVASSDQKNYQELLINGLADATEDVVLLEGPNTLNTGKLFNLSLPEMATSLNAGVVLVCRAQQLSFIDDILIARQQLGENLLGVVINDTASQQEESVTKTIQPFLEGLGIPVLGILPHSNLLRSISVDEIVKQLQAEVLCRPDRLDLMVETLTIGAMNVSSAVKYFRKAQNMAVVTGGDRSDIQFAALELSTQCLVLTGHLPPDPTVLNRAEELEVPVLSVDLDTLTTVEIIDNIFGHVRIHEPIKVDCVNMLMAEHFQFDRLFKLLS
jgi:BioD-like phosphotransacetylase family protein